MKTMVLRIFILLHVFCCSVSAYSASLGDHYKIEQLVSASTPEEMKENDVIKGENDTLLLPVTSVEGIVCRPGVLYKRTKTVVDQYELFEGVLDTGAFKGEFPLYVFQFPHWARLEDMLQYRMYREPTESIGNDERTLYFDNERIYSRNCSRLHYYRNGVWFTLTGTLKKPYGSLSVTSIPSGAGVILNGVATGKKTPCRINSLIGGVYSVEVKLANYHFFGKSVRVIPDSSTTLSFELIEDVDTIFINGDAPFCLLLLPQPPVDKPYVIDDSIKLYASRIRIPPGTHSIRWNGDERYVPLDTQVTVEEKRVVFFDYLFRLRYGIIRLVPTPFDADVCIEKYGCSQGERVEELPVGIYRVNVYRQGFTGVHQDLRVYSDTVITTEIDLRQLPDSDGDGYPDSVDLCPAEYGLYSGCTVPRLQPIITSLITEFADFVRNDKFTAGISLLGIVSKNPTNRRFRGFLSSFSDGRVGGVNNYRGLTALNSLEFTWRGLYCNTELGQWSSGVRYRRDDTLFVNDHSIFYFDSLHGVEPVLYIPSTSVSFGVHYNRSWLNVSYSLGYQWEDIMLGQLFDLEEYRFVNLTFDNDWWYHQLGLDIDFKGGDQYIPSLYFKMKYPFGKVKQTRWTVFNAGFQLKVTAGKENR